MALESTAESAPPETAHDDGGGFAEPMTFAQTEDEK